MTAGPERAEAAPSVVVFDIGNVLIQWDPRHLYREIFDGDEDLMERFLAEVCTPAWNLEQDRGRPWAEGVRELTRTFPDCAELIRAFYERWHEMVPDVVPGSPEILAELKERGVPLYAITNFSEEKWLETRRRFAFMEEFDGVVVSGEVRLVKPDPAIYRHLFDSHAVDPATALFIDDSEPNVEAARRLGMHAHHFAGSAGLRRELERFGLLG